MSYTFEGSKIAPEILMKAVEEVFRSKYARLISGGSVERGWMGGEGSQFFLQTAGGIFWGRVFTAPLTEADERTILSEYEKIERLFKQTVRPVIFFPSVKKSATGHSCPEGTLYFEYYFRRLEEGQTLGLMEFHFPEPGFRKPDPEKPREITAPRPVPSAGQAFYRRTLLTRDEITELLGIGLELAKIGLKEKGLTEPQKVA